jgi:hypothetical protein
MGHLQSLWACLSGREPELLQREIAQRRASNMNEGAAAMGLLLGDPVDQVDEFEKRRKAARAIIAIAQSELEKIHREEEEFFSRQDEERK